MYRVWQKEPEERINSGSNYRMKYTKRQHKQKQPTKKDRCMREIRSRKCYGNFYGFIRGCSRFSVSFRIIRLYIAHYPLFYCAACRISTVQSMLYSLRCAHTYTHTRANTYTFISTLHIIAHIQLYARIHCAQHFNVAHSIHIRLITKLIIMLLSRWAATQIK